MENTALILSIILFAVGVLGTVLPVLPGAILIYVGMFSYGFMTDFSTLDVTFFLIQALVLLLIFAVDFIASVVGTQSFGGSKQAIWGAATGTILGIIFFGPLGIVTGPFLGAVAAELLRGESLNLAIRVGFGTIVGFLGGTFLKICAEIIMITYFFMNI
ncbi:hypothetical protein EAL2_c07870 [Peptoclostridium acidaminophilum DSM 3953]|uniref:DUF456 domain-containing protein n=1 Tax=Peptoclostridium acidaminophilum DSM 3953 TaxID=1286171 RepID=W8TIQ4_PEPAC|nr:DUF456 domain-containing protein [Peptoclostridium acidaminophilum]AHM56087.1 hypothetical protein EAL2_c07870 [Peptoclostridium acidaminophilum DSM 3953]